MEHAVQLARELWAKAQEQRDLAWSAVASSKTKHTEMARDLERQAFEYLNAGARTR